MATRLEWTKTGLKLNLDVSAQPAPRISQVYPIPDLPLATATMLTAVLESVAQTGRTGIRVRSLGTLPGTPTASFAILHTATQGTTTATETLPVVGNTVNLLLDQPIPAATHTFALQRTDAGQLKTWPGVTVLTPADPTLTNIAALQTAVAGFGSDSILSVGEKPQAIALFNSLITQLTGLRTQAASIGAVIPTQTTLPAYLAGLGPYTWTDTAAGHDTTIPSPSVWQTQWTTASTEISALTVNIAIKQAADTAGKLPAGGTAAASSTALQVQNSVTGTNSVELVRGNMADNDLFRILVGGTASNAGFAELATADDGTEPIYVRQYTGVFATKLREAALLDAAGNTWFPGILSGGGITLGNMAGAHRIQPGGGTFSFLNSSNGYADIFAANITLSGNASVVNVFATSATFSGNVSAPNVVSGDNYSKTTNRASGVASLSDALPSGFYDSAGATDMPTTTWFHCITSTHTGSYAGNQYMLQMAAPFWGRNSIYFRTLDPSNLTGGWREIYHTGNASTVAAAVQAILASINAPIIGTYAQMVAYVPSSGWPYWYATDVTAPDGKPGRLYQWNGGGWTDVGTPQAVIGRVTAAVISAGAIGATALAAVIALISKIQCGYSENGSGYPTAGVQLDGTGGTPIKVGPGGMRIGPYGLLLDELVMRSINLLDGNGLNSASFTGWYKGNVNPDYNGGAPNIGCLWIQNTFTEWSNNCVTTMWNFKIKGTSSGSANGNNDNLDSLTHMEVEVWANQATDQKRMTIFVAIPSRNYSNRADYSHDDNCSRSNMTIKYRYGSSDSNTSSTSSGNWYTKAYCRIRIWNAYGPSAWRWYGMADIGVWNNGGINDPTAGAAPSGGGGGGGGGGGYCPAPWTLLDTLAGQIAARDIRPGMMVHTEHEVTGLYGDFEVEAVAPGVNDIWTLELEDGRALDFAPSHRLKTDFGYARLDGLYPGQVIHGTTPGVVKATSLKAEAAEVVQITVKDAHTYETSGLLSHNVKTMIVI